eukprot:scaffold303395_cov30-Tisochrysis_lutea.AAC.2
MKSSLRYGYAHVRWPRQSQIELVCLRSVAHGLQHIDTNPQLGRDRWRCDPAAVDHCCVDGELAPVGSGAGSRSRPPRLALPSATDDVLCDDGCVSRSQPCARRFAMAGTMAAAAAVERSSRNPAGSNAEIHNPASITAPLTCRTTCCTSRRFGVSAVNGRAASVTASKRTASRLEACKTTAERRYGTKIESTVAVGSKAQTATAALTTTSEGRTAPILPEMGKRTWRSHEHST